jgi:predicted PurR-regulated permease PerM
VVIVMLGVLGGAMAFGLIGLFLGPALLAVGYSLFAAWSSTVVSAAEGPNAGTGEEISKPIARRSL